VYGGVPPVAEIVTVELPPTQLIEVAFAVTIKAGGSVSVTTDVVVTPAASVTVNVWLPAGLTNVPVPVYGGVPPVAVTVIVVVPPPHRIAGASAVDDSGMVGATIVIAGDT
jgi:hypothetical protein